MSDRSRCGGGGDDDDDQLDDDDDDDDDERLLMAVVVLIKTAQETAPLTILHLCLDNAFPPSPSNGLEAIITLTFPTTKLQQLPLCQPSEPGLMVKSIKMTTKGSMDHLNVKGPGG